MHVTDWLPTFLSLAGANSSDILPNIDGIDQWQSLKQNSATSPRSELLYNIDPHPPGKMNKVQGMALPVVEFSREGYKIRNVFA